MEFETVNFSCDEEKSDVTSFDFTKLKCKDFFVEYGCFHIKVFPPISSGFVSWSSEIELHKSLTYEAWRVDFLQKTDLTDLYFPNLTRTDLIFHKSLADFIKRHPSLENVRLYGIDQECFELILDQENLNSLQINRGKFESLHLSKGKNIDFIQISNCRKAEFDFDKPFNMPKLTFLSFDNCKSLVGIKHYLKSVPNLKPLIHGSTPKEETPQKAKTKKQKKQPVFKTGDCLTFKLKNGNYGGAIVLGEYKGYDSAQNVILTTKINQKNKPTKESFRNSEVLVKKFGNWDNEVEFKRYSFTNDSENYKKVEHLIEVFCYIDIKKNHKMHLAISSNLELWEVINMQLEHEKKNPQPKLKKYIVEYLGKD